MPATRQLRLPGDFGTREFIFYRGGRLRDVVIGCESWGTLSSNRDNAVLLFAGLSASAHACRSEDDASLGWWEHLIGPGKPLDTNRFYVVCVNSLGSCFGSTSPSFTSPVSGKPYGSTFPDLSIEDIAKAGHHALWELGIERPKAVIGGSMGGMSVLGYAVQFPGEFDYLATISAACRALPFTIAIRSIQREIIRDDPFWLNGDYPLDRQPEKGMRAARKLGMMSYRAADEWRVRFNRARIDQKRRSGKPYGMEFEIESYLDYNAEKFVRVFDANSYLQLSRAMDWFDLADHGGSVNAALAKIHARRILVLGVPTDTLFPIDQQKEMTEGLRKAGNEVQFETIDAAHGHDSFLIDDGTFQPVLADFFSAMD